MFIQSLVLSKTANMAFWNNVFFPEMAVVLEALFDSLVVESLINMPVKERYTERVLMHFTTGKFAGCVPSWVTYVQYSIYDVKNQDILISKWKLLMLSFCN